jgi:biopolymer transport protein ExbD
MTKNQGVQVALPSAASAASLGDSQEMDKTVTLTVNEKGELFFNKEKVTRPQLTYKLQTYKSSTKDPRVIVTGDAKANFEGIVQVLDEARRIGIAKVGISTDKK